MKPQDLSSMLEEPEVIDLPSFSFQPEKKEELEKKEEKDYVGRDELNKLLEEVRATRAQYEESTRAKPPAEPPEYRLPDAPTDEQISKAIEDQNIALAMDLKQRQYVIKHFVPAIKELMDRMDRREEPSAKLEKAADHMAAIAIQNVIESNPELKAISGDIYTAFQTGKFSSEDILTPGVIQNVIMQVVGRKALEGTWGGSTRIPPGMSPSSVGSPETPEPLDPTRRAIFERLTGMKVDDDVIRTLSGPRAIDLGRSGG